MSSNSGDAVYGLYMQTMAQLAELIEQARQIFKQLANALSVSVAEIKAGQNSFPAELRASTTRIEAMQAAK